MRKLTAAALGAAGLTLMAGPALAKPGDSACMWNAAPAAARQAFLKAYASGDPDGAHNGIDPQAIKLLPTCRIKREDRYVASEAMTAYGIRVGAAQALKEHFGVEETRLQTYWDGLTAEERDTFSANMIAASDHPETAGKPDISLVIKAMQTLGLTDNAAGVQLMLYYTAGVITAHDDGRL